MSAAPDSNRNHDEELRALLDLVEQLARAISVALPFLSQSGLEAVEIALAPQVRVLPECRPPRALSPARVQDELSSLWASLETEET